MLSDWNLPKLSGLDFLVSLRTSGDATPSGFVTAERSREVRDRAVAAGALFVIAAPFTPEAFAEALQLMIAPAPTPDAGRPAPAGPDKGPLVTLITSIPPLKEVRNILSGLLGRDVDVAPGAAPPAVGGDSGSLVALYVDDSLRSVAVIVTDLELSARVGAAIGLVPAGAADTAIEDGVLSQSLRDNAHEELDVLANIFNKDGAPHLRLYTVAGTADELRVDVRAIAIKAAQREDVTVDVARYGKGVLSIVLV